MISVVKYLDKRVQELNLEIEKSQVELDNTDLMHEIEYLGSDLMNLESEKGKFVNAIKLLTKNGLY